jgi:hypothetical protein
MNIAEQQVAAFLPPQRSLGWPQRAAESIGHLEGSEGEMILSSPGANCSMRLTIGKHVLTPSAI